MAGKGGSKHLKRLAAPNYMGLKRKESKYILKPTAGRHTLDSSVALATFLREMIGVAGTAAEAKNVIVNGKIEINGRVRKSQKYPIGFGDIIKLIPNDESYLITVGKYGVFEAKKLSKGEHKRTLKVIGKYTEKGKKQMIRLNNGNIVNYDKEVMVNDSVVVENRKISKVLKFEEGAHCMVLKGIHSPLSGKITEIKKGTSLRDATVKVENKEGGFETLVENIIVVGA